MRQDIEQSLQKYARKKFGNELNQYDLILKPKGTDLNAPDIQDLLNQFRLRAISTNVKDGTLTKVWGILHRLSITFNEQHITKELDKLWMQGNIGIPLHDLEQKIMRNVKRVRLKNGKILNRSEMENSYTNIYQTLFDCFYHMVNHNNLPMEQMDLKTALAGASNAQINI